VSASVEPNCDLEGESSFVRVHDADGQVRDLNPRQWSSGEFDAGECEVWFLWHPLWEWWIPEAQTRGWYGCGIMTEAAG